MIELESANAVERLMGIDTSCWYSPGGGGGGGERCLQHRILPQVDIIPSMKIIWLHTGFSMRLMFQFC